MDISNFTDASNSVRDKESAIALLAHFISYSSAKENRDSSFSLDDKSFRRFLVHAEELADKWEIPFSPSLYMAAMAIHEGDLQGWRSSVGSCGWVNDGEVE